MRLKRWLVGLEKRRIITRKPHPIIPFALSAVIALIGMWMYIIEANKLFGCAFFLLAGFSLIFSIVHFLVVLILGKKK